MTEYVSRAGHKLDHAIEAFGVTVEGLLCADFGCNVGGFTDCLLQRGARLVYAVDTGYGALAYRLRTDPRVVVMERQNALHAPPPEPVDLVVIDVGWTPQRLAVPAALRWLRPGGRVISLVKPHYELSEKEKTEHLIKGRLDPEQAELTMQRIWRDLPALGAEGIEFCRSPLTGSKSSRHDRPGNVEFLLLARPRPDGRD